MPSCAGDGARRSRSCAKALAVVALLAAGCASALTTRPAPEVVRVAQAASAYSARLRVRLHGPSLRARTSVLLAFRRPDGLRVEVPGPGGARLIAVARGAELVAVFPAERAFFEGSADAAALEALLGVALTPPEVMDLLLGVKPPRVREYVARWQGGLPRQVDAVLPDGGRLRVGVDEADLDPVLAEAVFEAPARRGYRRVDAQEARGFWSGG